jgi:ATP-binding cassette subfamily B protein
VLKDIDFTVGRGEVVGVFGPTGCGKSTLLSVLARVYEPPAGSVYLSDVDITETPVENYWKSVALVAQEPFLFSRTIRENVALAARPGDVDILRLAYAFDAAALSRELEGFAEGMETIVGERGVTLSGGQRQRTALARGLYREFDLMLLDDVMSAVDHETEHHLIEAIYQRVVARSAVIVSHRISALTRADRILVLEQGRIVAQGTHEELLAKGGQYAAVWKLQNSEAPTNDGGPHA